MSKQIVEIAAEHVRRLFNIAKKSIKRPSLTLFDKAGDAEFSVAGQASKNPGAMYLKVDGQYVGKVTPDGVARLVCPIPSHAENLLVEFAADPANFAAENGKKAGRCCFCSRPLSDSASLELGYGPVCAKNYGLILKAWNLGQIEVRPSRGLNEAIAQAL